MKFVTADGRVYAVENIGELVSTMHDDSFAHSTTDTLFMEAMAKRVEASTDQHVRSDSVEHFVADLLAVGYLKEIPDDNDDEEEGEETHGKDAAASGR